VQGEDECAWHLVRLGEQTRECDVATVEDDGLDVDPLLLYSSVELAII
jgi:hypothetical protein